MDLDALRHYAPQLNNIAQKHGISRLFVFGSIARGESSRKSDVDFLLEMQPGASLLGAAGFSYEAEKLLNVQVDIIPTTVLTEINDQKFVSNVQRESVAL